MPINSTVVCALALVGGVMLVGGIARSYVKSRMAVRDKRKLGRYSRRGVGERRKRKCEDQDTEVGIKVRKLSGETTDGGKCGIAEVEDYGTDAEKCGIAEVEDYGTDAKKFGIAEVENEATDAEKCGTAEVEDYGTGADVVRESEAKLRRNEDAVGQARMDAASRQLEAAKNGNTNELMAALRLTMNTEIQNGRGKTALHLAVQNCSLDMVWLLLRNGANPNSVDHGGRTPLHLAAEYCDYEISRMLIAFGSSPLYRTYNDELKPVEMFERESDKGYELIRLLRRTERMISYSKDGVFSLNRDLRDENGCLRAKRGSQIMIVDRNPIPGSETWTIELRESKEKFHVPMYLISVYELSEEEFPIRRNPECLGIDEIVDYIWPSLPPPYEDCGPTPVDCDFDYSIDVPINELKIEEPLNKN